MIMRTALVLLLQSLFVVVQLWPAVVAQSNCTTACGDIKIPYPFGVANVSNCPQPRFTLICDNTSHPPTLLLGNKTEVTNVSYAGQITMLSPVTFDCYTKSGETIDRTRTGWTAGNLLTVSDTENKFTTLGCDTISNLTGLGGRNISNGCNMACLSPSDVINGSCTGIGCCQTSIPQGYGEFNISLRSFQNHTKVYDFNPCSYAFIAQSGWFNFSKSNLTNFTTSYPRNGSFYVPVVWDWAVRNVTCSRAQENMTTYACRGDKSKSQCVRAKNGRGYSCICSTGYQGNPYLEERLGGCTDINECKGFNNCSGNAICKNLIGSYSCRCRWGYKGNGWKKESSMYDQMQGGHPECADYVIITIGAVSAGIVVLPIIIWFFYWAKKEKQFQENGGRLLKRKINSNEEVKKNFKFFSYAELKNATEKFSDNLSLKNDPDFCQVLKGSPTNSKWGESSKRDAYIVKRYKGITKDQIIQFVNEVDALSQINHPHVVKLLGCCLDTKYPMLVYENVSEGKTLSQYIDSGNLSWKDRKRFATQMADALSYLVSTPMPPIFHGNFQSSNVLIEKDETSLPKEKKEEEETSEKLVAKICDFEASRLAPLYQAQYHQAQIKKKNDNAKDAGIELTERSVVYSFGVVLWELLTGKKEPVNLDSYPDYISDDAKEELEKVAKVVEVIKICLQVQSKERLTMADVAKDLHEAVGELGQGEPSSTSSSTTA